jgi:hypothetical protein
MAKVVRKYYDPEQNEQLWIIFNYIDDKRNDKK